MSSETLVADEVALSPRASIALLTLQLRAALHEAAVAEEEEACWDVDAALEQLRARLEPLVEDRRRALEILISRLRTDAAVTHGGEGSTTAAECSPAVVGALVVDDELALVDDEISSVDEEVRSVGELTSLADSSLVDELPLVDELALVDDEISSVDEEVRSVGELTSLADSSLVDERPLVDDLLTAPTSDTRPWARPMPGDVVSAMPVDVLPLIVTDVAEQDPDVPNRSQPSSSTVVIDADSFAQAFAAAFAVAFAALLDERTSAFGTGMPPGAMWRVAPTPVPTKKSFWASAWHADFLLSIIAMIIVLVVLIAWST